MNKLFLVALQLEGTNAQSADIDSEIDNSVIKTRVEELNTISWGITDESSVALAGVNFVKKKQSTVLHLVLLVIILLTFRMIQNWYLAT